MFFSNTRAHEKLPVLAGESDWQPPKQGLVIWSVESYITKDKPLHRSMTTSNLVNAVLYTLQKKEDALIKHADKGSFKTLLATMDETSLNIKIPHHNGIEECEEFWETQNVKDTPTQSLTKLLTLVLKFNNFEFRCKHYLQIQGTAMVTKMAPSYANIHG